MVCEHLIFALEMEDSFTNCYIDFFFKIGVCPHVSFVF